MEDIHEQYKKAGEDKLRIRGGKPVCLDCAGLL